MYTNPQQQRSTSNPRAYPADGSLGGERRDEQVYQNDNAQYQQQQYPTASYGGVGGYGSYP
jgi:hypothetical protein